MAGENTRRTLIDDVQDDIAKAVEFLRRGTKRIDLDQGAYKINAYHLDGPNHFRIDVQITPIGLGASPK